MKVGEPGAWFRRRNGPFRASALILDELAFCRSTLDRPESRFERMQSRHTLGVGFLERLLAQGDQRRAVIERFHLDVDRIFGARKPSSSHAIPPGDNRKNRPGGKAFIGQTRTLGVRTRT